MLMPSCTTSCSNPAEECFKSGLTTLSSSGIQAETDRFRHLWTEGLRLRDREAPGSNPGPPTISVFKSAISESLWSQRHIAGSQFPTEQPNRGGANRVVVGYVRSLVATGGHAASPAGGLTSQDREAPDAEFQARSALAIAPAPWLAFLSSSRNSPEIWPVEAVMWGVGYRASSQSRQR